MFNFLFETSVSKELKTSQQELNNLQNRIFDWKIKADVIKEKFNFYLPDYIIDEIIENEKTKNFVNLHYLINCAVVNNRLSESNAKLLRQVYKFN